MKAKNITDLIGRKISHEEFIYMESLEVKDGVRNIPPFTCHRHPSLKCVTIPESVKYIYSNVFSYCRELTTVIIHTGVTYIGPGAFHFCPKLSSIVIPDSVKELGKGAFSNCKNLQSIYVNSNNIFYDSRENCNAIIETKSNTLLLGCNSTHIPQGVVNIASEAFSSCPKLFSIIIPSSVSVIQESAFCVYNNYKSIMVESNNIFYDSRENCNAIIEKKSNKLILGCNNTIIPKDVEILGDYAFAYCNKIVALDIPKGIKEIGEHVFDSCKKLESITLPDGIRAIKNSTFYNCKSLKSIIIPQGVVEIESYAFYGCIGLTSLVIPEGVKRLGMDVFYNCMNLEIITLPSSLESIEISQYCSNLLFGGRSSLKSIIIPKGSLSKFEKLLPLYKSKLVEI